MNYEELSSIELLNLPLLEKVRYCEYVAETYNKAGYELVVYNIMLVTFGYDCVSQYKQYKKLNLLK